MNIFHSRILAELVAGEKYEDPAALTAALIVSDLLRGNNQGKTQGCGVFMLIFANKRRWDSTMDDVLQSARVKIS